MNAFENAILGLLAGAEAEVPLFVKSAQGNLILNASETVLGLILARFAPAPVAPAVAAPVPAVAPAKTVV